MAKMYSEMQKIKENLTTKKIHEDLKVIKKDYGKIIK